MKKTLIVTMTLLMAFTGIFAQTPVIDRKGSKNAETVYTCPMHPDLVSNKPGKCPKCGMTLVVKTQYTCPMHPDVLSDKPGKCPKCGMTLITRKIGNGPSGNKKLGGQAGTAIETKMDSASMKGMKM